MIRNRPAAVTVIAILNLVCAIGGGCGIAAMLLLSLASDELRVPNDFASLSTRLLSVNSMFMAFDAAALLLSGVGLFQMRAWARAFTLWYAWYLAIATVIRAARQMIDLWPMFAQVDRQIADQGPQLLIRAIGLVTGVTVNLAYAWLLIYYMTRPWVIAAFRGVAGPEMGMQPEPAQLILPEGVPESGNPYASPILLEAPASVSPVAIPAGGGIDSVMETMIPSKNGAALAAYYLGLVSLFPCAGFPLRVAAVYYGISGLRNVRQNPAVRGGIHAWVGVICGSLFGLFNLALVAVTVLGMILALNF